MIHLRDIRGHIFVEIESLYIGDKPIIRDEFEVTLSHLSVIGGTGWREGFADHFEYDPLRGIAQPTKDEGETLATWVGTILCYGDQELIRK